ncbi:small GTP-binding protein [Histomonas meleagridis]|uniref:small GTP-binding protein n=1 Tax=Histomonas meleagridis TaxID=135588 RepID=UPI00355A7F68|nr:small GTP-binding protein [Histomonas meleagridis]KAH0798771.1 small GTP-binding protein [Histomonas meleagridis]
MLVEDDKITFRVVTIGDSSVGKTCIINRFINNKFQADQQNTVGAAMESFNEERNGKKIEIQIWDTAGQEQYKSLGAVYYRGAAAVIFVFDLSNYQSFKNLDEWLNSFQQAGSDKASFFLVGNKSDLDIEVPEKDINDWANEHNCHYFSTSAKTGENINKLYEKIVDVLFESSIQELPEVQNILRTETTTEHKEKKSCC